MTHSIQKTHHHWRITKLVPAAVAAAVLVVVVIMSPAETLAFTTTGSTSFVPRRYSSFITPTVGLSSRSLATATTPTVSMTSTDVSQSETIVSPFDDTNSNSNSRSTNNVDLSGPLDLTYDNVELVLDEMRPYLIQDGGNVVIKEIDGPVVKLQLEGACGTCPSSTQTMKMGLERGLKERIPEIQEVIQAMPEGPPLTEEQVDVILDGVRPFLNVAGGSINLDRFEGIDGLQPTIWLRMQGASATLNSVKLEIAQRLQRHFMIAGLRVEWVE